MGEFFRFVRIADPLQAEAIDALEVPGVQVLECATVPGLKELDENSVSTEVDIIRSKRHLTSPAGLPCGPEDSGLEEIVPGRDQCFHPVDIFDYPLVPERIAQVPVEPRSAARLLDATHAEEIRHRRVDDLPELVGPGDLLVVNTTRVLPARVHAQKPTGGHVEVLLLELHDDGRGVALVRPSRRVAAGTVLHVDDAPVVEVGGYIGDGTRAVRLLAPLDDYGTVPLPPYIETPLSDPERYQTVYAERPTSVAAPTAGLHLTQEVLARCREQGASIATVDLSVGLATFQPITASRVEDHHMHSERYVVPDETLDAAERADRVIAIGTTTVRALEAAALGDSSGSTDLFIRAPFEFRVVDVLFTNFHMPRSSLLVLLHAFCGDRWRELYDVALRDGYRFLSFGDAMIVGRA